MGKGYKMYTVIDKRHAILGYIIRPMNEAEQTVALELVKSLPDGVTRIVATSAMVASSLRAGTMTFRCMTDSASG